MSAYDPKKTDPKWIAFWKQHHCFKANATSEKPPFSMVIPPPNVTGVLHMGHALVNCIQDVLARYRRMLGDEVLWVPGTDHAGIATQTIVERHLLQKYGKRRTDYSREDFLHEVWAWKERSEARILEQLHHLGCSYDVSRLRFTLDAGCNRAVKVLFKRMFDEGLIYRGLYLVNWDPVTQTALADDEVEYEEKEGFLWTFAYPLVDPQGEDQQILVATTRPETMLGDTAIAVSPHDTRYHHLIGRKVRVPIVEREIPIIADLHVDPMFGTGAVKVTPAHDPNDYRMGLAHDLPMISLYTPDGRLNEHGGPFVGCTREEAREGVIEGMRSRRFLVKVDPYRIRVGVSYRSKAVIEPMLSKQWFVKMDQFKQVLRDAVDSKEVELLPAQWEATYFHWIDHLRDWCISRQLWWGHQIPIWYHREDPDRMICYEGEGVPPEVMAHPDLWYQDSDVLDTWFSSALWPFSTLGWPERTPDFEKFYPTRILVTGHDILFFWVARMMCMGHYATGRFPFPKAFLHGLIYGRSYWKNLPEGGITYLQGEDKKQLDLGAPMPPGVYSKWEKLSKTKGNVIDPMDLIAEYGTDAVRMTLCHLANQTPQIDLDRRAFEEFKNFANKIWNGARFVLMHLDGMAVYQGLKPARLADRWIRSRCQQVISKVREALDHCHFDLAAQAAYSFFWKEFCAYYLEFSKPILQQNDPAQKQITQECLLIVLIDLIRLIHPMAPCITEELFAECKQRFGHDLHVDLHPLQALCCALSTFPNRTTWADPQAEQEFHRFEELIHGIRKVRGELALPPQVATDLYLVGPIHPEVPQLVSSLVKTRQIFCQENLPSLPFHAMTQVGPVTILVPLPESKREEERGRLAKEQQALEEGLFRVSQLLTNQDFLAKAKPELVAKKQEEMQRLQEQITRIQEKLSQLGSAGC